MACCLERSRYRESAIPRRWGSPAYRDADRYSRESNVHRLERKDGAGGLPAHHARVDERTAPLLSMDQRRSRSRGSTLVTPPRRGTSCTFSPSRTDTDRCGRPWPPCASLSAAPWFRSRSTSAAVSVSAEPCAARAAALRG